jgi:hypothetical protein
VGTPKGRLSKLEADLSKRPWQSVRPGVEVKVLPQENELYVFAQSRDRLKKSGRCADASSKPYGDGSANSSK